MDMKMSSPDRQSNSLSTSTEHAPSVVFQPQKLKEVVEIIDLMGNVATRVREDSSGDLPAAGMAGATARTGQTGTSARDEAIANAPAPAVMQQKLVSHIRQEIATIERQAKKIAKSGDRGSAFMLSNLYRKIRSLSALIANILEASVDTIKRFYISVFIDRQPLVVTGGSLAQSDE
jgi:hypothetical protein